MVQSQFSGFILYLLSGIFICIIYDFFRSLRLSIKTSDYSVNIEDAIFIIIIGFILLKEIYTYNYGIIRLYMLLGIIIGAILYLYFISKTIIQVNIHIIKTIKVALRKIIKIFMDKIGIHFFSIVFNKKKLLKKVKKHQKS